MTESENDSKFILGFSKGCASHTSIENALLSSILEFIEIDACMIQWYTKSQAPKNLVDSQYIRNEFPLYFKNDSEYEVVANNLSGYSDVGAYVMGIQIINKTYDRPLIVYGAQADLDPSKCIYRDWAWPLSKTS